jgi:hypothetical protein
MKRLIQQDFRIEDAIAIAVGVDHLSCQTREVVLGLGIEQEMDQSAYLVYLVRGSVTASSLSSAAILVQAKVDLAGHVEAVVVWQVTPMSFGRIDSAVGRVSLAYGDLLDCSIAALAQMEAEVATEHPYHHSVILGSEQAGLAIEELAVRPASQLDFGHRIHVTRESIPWCTSGIFSLRLQ